MSMREEFLRLQNQIDKIVAKKAKRITQDYQEALDELRGMMAAVYAKYESSGVLLFREMAKYNRAGKLDKEIQKILNKLGRKTAKNIKGAMELAYTESFEQTKKLIGAAANQKIPGVIKNEVLQQALENPVKGLKLSRTLEKNRVNIIYTVQQTVEQGLKNGESYGQMAGRLKTSLENDAPKAMRVVRTETHRVMEQAKLDSMEQAQKAGIELTKKWVSSRDERVRSSHISMDGKVVDYDEDFVNPLTGGRGPGPGMMGVAADDVNCRCIFTIDLKDMEPAPSKGAKEQPPAPSPVVEEVQTLLQNAPLDDREKLARHMLDNSGLNHVKIQVGDIGGSWGACLVPATNGKLNVTEFMLNGSDGRPNRHQIKTVFHELTHARIHGIPTKENAIVGHLGAKLHIEETIAETVGHYLVREAGISGEIAPSYSRYLVINLPKLKRLPEYADCETIADFGRILAKYRYGNGPRDGAFQDIADYLDNEPLDMDKYASQYESYVKANMDSIVDAIYDNQGSNNTSLKGIIKRMVEQDWQSKNYTSNAFTDSLAVAMNRLGVK